MVMKTVNPGSLVTQQGNCTSTQLFSKLSRFNCKIGILAFFLEKCEMYEPLYLLKDRVPVVIVNHLPEETRVKMNTTVELGFEVSSDGFPKPTFQWFLNDAPLASESATFNPLVIPTFRNSDAGFYKCEITQQCRDGSFQTISTGSSKMTLENCAPFVVTEPQDLCTDPGNVIELSCMIEGNPIPRFQWYKNDYPISNEVTTILKISSAVPQHSGRYRCLATNSEGKTLTREAFVEVRLPPTSQRLRAAFSDVPTQHSASMKQALLIGNWTYDAHGLRKVRADVKTLHDILYKMEFEVISLCNLGKVEILHAADRLCELLLPDAYVVVYFAGHGIHYSGHDYLMPVDLKMNSEYSVRDLVDGNEIIARIQQRHPKLLVVLLDMCRTIPQQGINSRIADELLRQVPRDSRSNLVMAWATAENSFAYEMGYEENGIFMTYLKRAMENRNILVTDMLERLKQNFKQEIPIEAKDQMPITSSSLAEPLSLYDPVDGSVIGGSLWNDCQMLAISWKELPQKQIATIQTNGWVIHIYIQFGMMDDCFSNGLKIELTTEGYDKITFQPSIHPPVLELLEVKHQMDLKKCTITLHKLQALMEDASLVLRIAEFPNERILVHLGQPLIAVARLSANYF
ncbi:mucosa-associated lymphoid tissue lymphoma translocation protein 1-like isoform X3 [Daphnia pulex]|nr:mucosa-associated lymphoid tissue lymphoma translocation protein 1-like isoform X3 [Daphnia pulex]